jgi:hypothetical protein
MDMSKKVVMGASCDTTKMWGGIDMGFFFVS